MMSYQKEELMELDSLVEKASRVVGHSWPMPYFVHHNPINSLENLPFHEAIRVANQFLGSRGYLPNEKYRKQVESGRIKIIHLDSAIQSHVLKHGKDSSIELGGKQINRSLVIRAHFLKGITPPLRHSLHSFLNNLPNEKTIRLISKKIDIVSHQKISPTFVYKNMTSAEWCDRSFNTNIVERVNNELIKWCESFMDEGHATWSMPDREKGFYEAWRSLASDEWSACGIRNSDKKIKALPKNRAETVLEKLNMLCIPKESWQEYISLQLASLHGWSSFINWRSKNLEYPWQKKYPIDLVQYLAVRLFYEWEMVGKTCWREIKKEGNFKTIAFFEEKKLRDLPSKEDERLVAAWQLLNIADSLKIPVTEMQEATPQKLESLLLWVNELPEAEHGPIWLDAYEHGYIQELISELKTPPNNVKEESSYIHRPAAQLMFCIDVRSEPFRRNLEAIGDYETFGFAGFFGIPISVCAHGKQHFTAQCPAIIQPKHLVNEVIRSGEQNKEIKNQKVKKISKIIKKTFNNLKNNFISPFITVEAFGWFFGWHLIERTFYPGVYRKWWRLIKEVLVVPVTTEILINQEDSNFRLTEKEQISYVEDALKTMGITKDFARIVLVTAHTSLSENNPYEAALNCGACGGNSGEPNSRLFAKIVNKVSVRKQLKRNGIFIPEDTHFVSAVHNTTTDYVQILDIDDVPYSHLKELEAIKLDLEKAAVRNTIERCKKLPGLDKNLQPKEVKKEVLRRSGDWSETRPEWGLSGNASFIIGKRSLTIDINLKGRAFLNSYDHTKDPDGALLEGILMGPMIVGQWINAEHYFSTTDPEIFGSGNKIYHNVVGNIGVMSGPQSDLRVGLPIQTTTNGENIFHEPLRLCVFIDAPRKEILNIIKRQESLRLLFDNEWVRLFSIEKLTKTEIFLYKSIEGWLKVRNT